MAYTTAAAVLDEFGPQANATTLMLAHADAMIEDRTGEKYDGSQRVIYLSGNAADVIPFKAWPIDRTKTISVQAVDSNGTVLATLDATYYVLKADGLYSLSGNWAIGTRNYKVSYYRPGTPPTKWAHVATQLAGLLALWRNKYATDGIVGQKGQLASPGGTMQVTAQYPPSLLKQLQEVLDFHFPKDEQRQSAAPAVLSSTRSGHLYDPNYLPYNT